MVHPESTSKKGDPLMFVTNLTPPVWRPLYGNYTADQKHDWLTNHYSRQSHGIALIVIILGMLSIVTFVVSYKYEHEVTDLMMFGGVWPYNAHERLRALRFVLALSVICAFWQLYACTTGKWKKPTRNSISYHNATEKPPGKNT